MGFNNCCTCGKAFKDLDDNKIYCDGGIMEINHGEGQCRECYSKSHNFCPKCKNQPLTKQWNYCPICGTKVK